MLSFSKGHSEAVSGPCLGQRWHMDSGFRQPLLWVGLQGFKQRALRAGSSDAGGELKGVNTGTLLGDYIGLAPL